MPIGLVALALSPQAQYGTCTRVNGTRGPCHLAACKDSDAKNWWHRHEVRKQHVTCTRVNSERVPCHLSACKGSDANQPEGTCTEPTGSMGFARVEIASVRYTI